MQTNLNIRLQKLTLLVGVVFMVGCTPKEKTEWQCLDLRVTAYNSVHWQTDNTPRIGAWGDTLYDSVPSIAVSRDLLRRGFTKNTKVRIQGLPGVYLVKDKMATKWRNKIDIFMGDNITRAKKWGIQKRSVYFEVKNKKRIENKNE